MPAYRFNDFLVSPKRRVLARGGHELPLIPRYFDLLVLLLERRREAVHRREIFDRVWGDVIVSDTALNQAIRTIRRTLGDDSREPRYIRTVARHGYQFVFPGVTEGDDDELPAVPEAIAAPAMDPEPEPVCDYEPLLLRIVEPARTESEEEDRRDAAERLHAMSTAEALRRLGTRPGHVRARALLRDARWDSPGADAVPIAGGPDAFGVARELVLLRLRRASRLAATRWAGASLGGGIAGAAAGAIGGLILAAMGDNDATAGVAPVLAAIGGGCGAIGGAGVGAGLAIAETTARSARTIALVIGAALGGAAVGLAVQVIARRTLAALVGLDVATGGAIEGLVIGAAAGLGYALATRAAKGGMAAPRGRRRVNAALVTAALCGTAALGLTAMDRPLVGGTVHLIARESQGSRQSQGSRESQGSQVSLAPLGRLVGEPDFGPVSRAVIGFGEAAVFGLGLAFGLTRRGK